MNERVAQSLNLHYQDGGAWRPIPHWAKFLISLGASIASTGERRTRVVVSVSVPSPCYAASFIALGRILAEPIVEPDPAVCTSHFATLASLPTCAPVIYFNGTDLVCGPFLGVRSMGEEEYVEIGLQKRKQKATCMIPQRWSLRVEPEPEHQGPARRNSTGRLRKPKPLVEHFFTREQHYRILCTTAKPVAVIGDTNRFRAETVGTKFAALGEKGWIEGSLQDLLRVSKFAGGAIGCRSDIVSKSRDSAHENSSSRPAGSLVILDGASATIRRIHQYTNPNVVAVLPRTESDYSAAVDLLNSRYVNRAEDFEAKNAVPSSKAISVMAHTEVRP